MAATKNAHDWHCEDHDTYGWRGEECRKCPTAPSEADALRNELNRLVDLCRHMNDERLCLAHGVVEMKPFPETLERGVIISEPLLREIERRYNKFKAVEAENKRLREFCEFAWRDVPMNEYAFEKLEALLSNHPAGGTSAGTQG